MLIRTSGYYARLAPDQGQPLVYLDFIEVAPWNLRLSSQQPRYKIVGLTLVRSAVQASLDCGFRGRIGLKALPQAEPFYAQVCGMVPIAPARYNDLVYYEFTATAANEFLQRGLP